LTLKGLAEFFPSDRSHVAEAAMVAGLRSARSVGAAREGVFISGDEKAVADGCSGFSQVARKGRGRVDEGSPRQRF
jgi:hypothetical protein